MFKYFLNCSTLIDVKIRFRDLAKKYHPDIIGGDGETFKEINNEYELAFNYYRDSDNNNDSEKKYKNEENHTVYQNIINVLVKCEGLIIEICGDWIWISGNTFIHKDIIHNLEFSWSKSKKKWYYAAYLDKSKKVRGSKTMNEIRSKYGSDLVEIEKNKYIGCA